MKKVCVILVNWNGWADTIECLESLFRLQGVNAQIVICDNGSTDSSLEKIKAWADGELLVESDSSGRPRQLTRQPCAKPVLYVEYDRLQAEKGGLTAQNKPLVLISIDDNLGFAGGNNVGIRYAMAQDDFDYVWLLNNDTVVEPDALEQMVLRMSQSADAGMCGSTLLYYEDPEKVQALGGGYYCKWIGLPWHQGRIKNADDDRNRPRVEKWMNYIVGASILVSRDFLRDIGLMCEDYFLYFEETDWAIRSAGKYRLVYAPESVVYHKVGASIGTSSVLTQKSLTCDFYNVRNRLFFTRRFYPYALPTVYLVLVGAVVMRLLLGRWQRAKMILRLMFDFERLEYKPD